MLAKTTKTKAKSTSPAKAKRTNPAESLFGTTSPVQYHLRIMSPVEFLFGTYRSEQSDLTYASLNGRLRVSCNVCNYTVFMRNHTDRT